MVLDTINLHDVLQVDATVIAGLLILLTLLSFRPQKFQKGPEYVFPPEMSAEEKMNRAMKIRADYAAARETERVETTSRYLIATMTVGGIWYITFLCFCHCYYLLRICRLW
jgi:hypothetical protein